jgi:SdpC family antimicrobial peptide
MRTLAVFTLVCHVVTFTACVGGDGTTQTAGRTQFSQSGEDLFLGIFFGEGQVGQLLPEIWKGRSTSSRALSPEKTEQVLQAEANIVAEIHKQDPSFFQRFGLAVTSGDHFEVEAALMEAGSRLHTVSDAAQKGASNKAPNVWVDRETVLYWYLAGVVFLIAAVIDFNPATEVETQGLQSEGGSRLKRDVVIDLVATRLAASP